MRASRENAKPTLLRRALACLVSAAMVVAFTPVVAWGETSSATVELDINQGSIEITSTGYKAAGNTTETLYTGSYTIKSTTTGAVQNTITVSSGKHNITLSGVNIQFAGDANVGNGKCAFNIISGSKVNLTLTGTNTLQSGMNTAGLQVPSGSSLTIDGNGSLTATGGDGGAGIGGGFDGAGGNITIRGGTVCAYGGNFGAGIGGGNCGFGRYITITGGTVCAYGGDGAAGIGGGATIGGNSGDITVSGGTVTATGGTGGAGIDGNFKTESNGNAVIFASSIADKSNESSWSGVIFEGNSGAVYGSPTLNSDLTFPGAAGTATASAKTLTVPENKTLTIAKDTTLTIANGGMLDNNGAIINKGTITGSGTLDNANGSIYMDAGTVSADGAVYYPLSVRDGSAAETNTSTLGGKIYGKAGGEITLIASREGYSVSWDVGGSSPVTVGEDNKFTMPNGAVIVAATWKANQYTITFESNGDSDVASITQDYGTVVTKPADPTKDGYTFAGWYSDEELSQPYTFTTMPAKDITLYAKWTANAAYIVFEENSGTAVSDMTGTTDEAISNRDMPTTSRTGYTFEGWYSDAGLSSKVEQLPEKFPVGTTTYYAKWTINQYTITFDTNGGSEVAGITQDYGTAITAPAEPSKEGYTFAGWYKDSGFTGAWDFTKDTIPAGDITLYAKWFSTDASVKSVAVKGVDATVDNANRTVEVTLPYNVALPTVGIDFEIVTTSDKAQKTQPGKEAEGTWKFTVTAEDSNCSAIYTVTVKQQPAPYVPPTYNVPAAGEGGIAVRVTLIGSTAVVGEISASALESAAGSGAVTITIDLSGLPKGVTQAQLSKTTVDKLLAVVNDTGNAVESVTMKFGSAALVIDAKALAAIVGQMKGANVTLGVKEGTADSLNSAQQKALSPFEVVQLYFEAEIKSGGTEIHDFGGGAVRVSVAFEPKPGHNPARYVVLYIAEDGAIERYATAWAAGMLSFTAPHFSTYAVVYVEDEAQAAIQALEALPIAEKLKTSQAKEAVKKAKAALAQVAALDAGQKMLVDEALIVNAQEVVKRGNELVATADKKAVGKVKDKAFTVKAGSSKSIYFKTKASAAGTKVTFAKTKGSKYISVTKAGKVTAKKGMKKGKTYTAKVKVTCGASSKTVKVTVRVQ